MDEPKTAKQFNAPFMGDAEVTTTATSPFTIASGAALHAELQAEMTRRSRLFAALADVVPDPELRRVIIGRVVEIYWA